MDLSREAIERSDFPSARRGHDPAAVAAHLRAVADAVEALRAERAGGSVSAVAGERVQQIVAAAEASAAEIRAAAEREARAEVERAREESAAVRSRLDELTREADMLFARLREAAGATLGSLRREGGAAAAELDALEADIVRAGAPAAPGPAAEEAEPDEAPLPRPGTEPDEPAAPVRRTEPDLPEQAPAEEAEEPVAPDGPAAPEPAARANGESAGAEGARLVALNLALGGSSREETARYLRDQLGVEDPQLLDEVYARAGG